MQRTAELQGSTDLLVKYCEKKANMLFTEQYSGSHEGFVAGRLPVVDLLSI